MSTERNCRRERVWLQCRPTHRSRRLCGTDSWQQQGSTRCQRCWHQSCCGACRCVTTRGTTCASWHGAKGNLWRRWSHALGFTRGLRGEYNHSSPAASLPHCACSHAPSRLRFAAACARGEAEFSPRTPWRQGRRLQCASSLPICDRYSRMDARLRHALQHRMQTHSGLHGTAQALTRLYHERGRRAGARLERAQQESKARITAAKAALARVREECAKVEEDAREHTRKMHVHQRRVSAAAPTLD